MCNRCACGFTPGLGGYIGVRGGVEHVRRLVSDPKIHGNVHVGLVPTRQERRASVLFAKRFLPQRIFCIMSFKTKLKQEGRIACFVSR